MERAALSQGLCSSDMVKKNTVNTYGINGWSKPPIYVFLLTKL